MNVLLFCKDNGKLLHAILEKITYEKGHFESQRRVT